MVAKKPGEQHRMLVTGLRRSAVQMYRSGIRFAGVGRRPRFVVGMVGAAVLCLIPTCHCSAQTSYYRHTFFDNGPHSATYFYSSGKAVGPSTLDIVDKKLPLSSEIFFTPPNSLRISWTSKAGGSWGAQIRVLEFRD